MRVVPSIALWSAVAGIVALGMAAQAVETPADTFHNEIKPILTQYCGDCHMDGAKKGGVAFDEFKTDQDAVTNKELWSMALKNVRGHIMPPPKKDHPTADERAKLVDWIKYGVFGVNPKNIDPGRVTVRRLNRVEYRNTIRDLMGVDFNTDEEFPADDTGYGFDDIGDVLTLSPMLLEKYLNAARTIVEEVVPTQPRVMPERMVAGRSFHETNEPASDKQGNLSLSYYDPSFVVTKFHVAHAGQYKLALDLTANEKYVEDQFDQNRCRLIFRVDGKEMGESEYVRETSRPFHYSYGLNWPEGDHEMSLEVVPLTHTNQIRSLTLRIKSVTVTGPDDPRYWEPPKNYARYFPKPVPESASARRAYMKELLGAFATKAFRRPVDGDTVERLTDLAEARAAEPGSTFEAGVAHGMMAALTSPQFLFREERPASAGPYSYIDEYSLASRLSYFLWSTMPDDELISLASAGKLRANLDAQVKRMLADPKSSALAKNFTGQWLQARDIDTVAIEPLSILTSQEKADPQMEEKRERYRKLNRKDNLTADEKDELARIRPEIQKYFRRVKFQFDYELRNAMHQEVELYFEHIVHDDRSVIEFLDSDYTFLNEKLAKHYGLTNLNLTGSDMRLVYLPLNCARGGVLTMGSMLAVTSNPTRTSPVKRGLFLLDNVLGNPPPPPPPNIPALEDVDKGTNHVLTLRETLAIHRNHPVCASCHDRMDPLGLAWENFNAMGMWREHDQGEPINVASALMSGEPFNTPQELKRILAVNHRDEFYRTLTEKLLTYAIGRGLEYQDIETVDEIVDKMDRADGRFSVLLNGVIDSVPFQKMRSAPLLNGPETAMTKEKP